MKTININGKEYTEEEFKKMTNTNGAFRGWLSCDYDLDELIEDIFIDLRDDFPRHEPEPPKLRPMSELPELNVSAHFFVEFEGSFFWTEGAICIGRIELRLFEQNCYKSNNYISEKGIKIHKWLPFRTLPEPNDIKL